MRVFLEFERRVENGLSSSELEKDDDDNGGEFWALYSWESCEEKSTGSGCAEMVVGEGGSDIMPV